MICGSSWFSGCLFKNLYPLKALEIPAMTKTEQGFVKKSLIVFLLEFHLQKNTTLYHGQPWAFPGCVNRWLFPPACLLSLSPLHLSFLLLSLPSPYPSLFLLSSLLPFSLLPLILIFLLLFYSFPFSFFLFTFFILFSSLIFNINQGQHTTDYLL